MNELIYWLISILEFLDRGGLALYLIAFATLLMSFLFFEFLFYQVFTLQRDRDEFLLQWQRFAHSEESIAIAKGLKAQLSGRLQRTLPMIQALIRITPVLGLFGTVTGMMSIFDVIATQGSGDARAMADGISAATLPTMTGMAVAIVGLVFQRIHRFVTERQLARFGQDMETIQLSSTAAEPEAG